MKILKILSLLFLLALSTAPSLFARTDHAAVRKQAQEAYRNGNWKDAYQLYSRLCLEIENDPRSVGSDLLQAWQCLRSLNRIDELDEFREKVIARHADNWRLLKAAAASYSGNNHYGYLVAGRFHRGPHRGSGKFVNAVERDRVRALQLMRRAMNLLGPGPSKTEIASFYLDFARIIFQTGGHHRSWRLQYLTDLTRLPDYEPGYGYAYGSDRPGAPVNSEGQPVFYPVPSSFETAASDGQRWRWLLATAARTNPAVTARVKYTFAAFLLSQFGVQTLSTYRPFLARRLSSADKGPLPEELRPYEVHTLTDGETLARLATGVKRFTLADEFNYIVLFKQILQGPDQGYTDEAARDLARIYENRRLYDRAVEYWKIYKQYNSSYARKQIHQILDNWGAFEPLATQPAGRIPTVEYRFRNGARVNFKAYRIRVARLLKDVQAYLQSNPRRLDRGKAQVNNIGWRLVHENQTRYIGNLAAGWNLKLNPDQRHWDRRVTVKIPAPLSRPGAYLLVARMQNGNTARIIIWVSNTTIIKKPLDKQVLYYVADAVNGKPLGRQTVEFFGYRTERIKDSKRYRILYKNFSRQTDGNGQIILDPSQISRDYHWLTTVRTDTRLAYLGFHGIWYPNHYDRKYNQAKTFVMTDRPVYRPGQKVRFKLWVRQARYDMAAISAFAGQRFNVVVYNPKNEQVYSGSLRADDYGGLAGEFDIPADAPLGVYRISHGSSVVYGGNTFRVEEYKKPEFEVKVEAPAEPVPLGEKITAVIRADYYFGSPVTRATVRYKVYRSAQEDRWYPAAYWDWLYGPGYWWYGYDYLWYPGWEQWGCKRPLWGWWPQRSKLPPEIVADGEVKIGPDGTVRIEIDTRLAKLIHPDTDHRYRIFAEVRDQSRRTIVGEGEVLVARQPFKVYAWTDRGHYRVGETIQAGFKAQSLARKPVQGKGLLRLLRITYDENTPRESEVARWSLDTDAAGRADVQIQASRPGQYRLSYRLTDKKGHAIEGGYIFIVRGEGDDGARFRFAKIELVPDKRDYAPGQTVRLMINTDYPGAAVLLFLRPANGVYLPPQVIHMTGKTTVTKIAISQKDMPNFFVEAMTVYDGRVYTETREIIVPPEKRVLNVDIAPSKNAYRPGEKAAFKLKLTDYNGRPFQGTAVMTVYDRALEYIAGGSNVPEIRKFFWQWRRRHYTRTESNLSRRFYNLIRKNETPMRPIGIFGHLVPQDIAAGKETDSGQIVAEKSVRSHIAPAPAGPAALASKNAERRRQPTGDGPPALKNLVKPPVRTRFADTAYWAATIRSDAQGLAEVAFDMPENLTGWKVLVWAMGHGTRVGQGTVQVVTRKDLILRLQAPRFFVETDEVVLSANVHNYLPRKKTVAVRLEFDGGCLLLAAGEKSEKALVIDAAGEARVDWRISVAKEGQAVIRMLALTDEASDAVQMQFPVVVHGAAKQVPKSGVIRPQDSETTIVFQLPAERRVDASRLELRFTPTLAGAMVDALPYLASYPYGCTEQTLNRFLPAVITQRILKGMGLTLQAIKEKQTNLNAQQLGNDRQRAGQWRRYEPNPVFDEKIVADMVAAGIKRLAAMRLSDGGWGWFSGWGEKSYPHTTAYVVHGLQIARQNGVTLPAGMLANGIRWLQNYQDRQIAELEDWQRNHKDGKSRADNLDALVYMVLVDESTDRLQMRDFLYRDRSHLAVYAKAMFGMALHRLKDNAKLDMILRNIEQYLVSDDENQTAYLNLPNQSYWWHWYGSEYEAHAYYLKLLSRIDPENPTASRLVKYLLNNRVHATYWKSTRDTAVVVEALAEYLKASGETRPDLTLAIFFDGRIIKTVKIDAENLFTFDNRFVLEGRALTTGTHQLTLKKSGRGPIYFNAYLDYFTLEDFITREGLEIKIRRNLFRLREVDKKLKDAGSRGQVVDRRVQKYERQALANLASVDSGDLVEVELVIESKNDYEYLVFEDLKAAGFEPVQVRSGYDGSEMGAYVEYRDRKVCFFVRRLARGRHSISYRLRAETPGKFSALPARAYAMYAPELKANSNEFKLVIMDH